MAAWRSRTSPTIGQHSPHYKVIGVLMDYSLFFNEVLRLLITGQGKVLILNTVEPLAI